MLFVGLGNPDDKYLLTRHNIGFMIIDALATKLSLGGFQRKFDGLYTFKDINGDRHYFLKPLTYMNLSGISVRELANFYKIETHEILIIHDELNLPFGKIKLRHNGSAGGHNGITSIIDNLGTSEFARLKFGIDRLKDRDTASYVLSKFNDDEAKALSVHITTAVDAVLMVMSKGIQKTMTEFNK